MEPPENVLNHSNTRKVQGYSMGKAMPRDNKMYHISDGYNLNPTAQSKPELFPYTLSALQL